MPLNNMKPMPNPIFGKVSRIQREQEEAVTKLFLPLAPVEEGGM
jgi:hypothetical protein